MVKFLGILFLLILLISFLIFWLTYIFLISKTHSILKKILSGIEVDKKASLNRLKKIRYINVISLTVLILMISYIFINSILSVIYVPDEVVFHADLDSKYYTKPTRGVPAYGASLWVILNYPDEKGMDGYEVLQTGKGRIIGKILLNGEALSKSRFTIILNEGLLRKDNIKTGKKGEYEIKAPFGEYSLNAFKIYDCRVNNKVSLQSEHMFIIRTQEDPLKFTLNEKNKDYTMPTVVIADPIKIITKEVPIYYLSKVKEDSKIFEWHPVRGANHYTFEVTRVTKNDKQKSTSFHPITKENGFYTKNDYLLFKEFKDLCNYFEPGVYGIKVFSYNRAKKILTYSSDYTQIAFNE